MLGAVHRFAHRGNGVRNGARSFVVHHHNGLDVVVAILTKNGLHLILLRSVTPVTPDKLHVQAETDRHVLPQSGELAGLEHQDLVPRGEGVDNGSLPRSGARGGEDHDPSAGLKNRLEVLQKLQSQPAELGPAVIDGRPRYRAQNTVRNVAGSGNLKEVTSALASHSSPSSLSQNSPPHKTSCSN